MVFFKYIYIVIFSASIGFLNPNNQDKNRIKWNENTKLQWKDFKGIPIKEKGLKVAETSVEIIMENGRLENGIPNYDVNCYFLKTESWTIVEDKLTLEHEQLHFDINEIYTRKIRKVLCDLNNRKISNLDNYFEVCDNFLKKCAEYNKKYDSEAYFNEAKQKEWYIKVKTELEELKE